MGIVAEDNSDPRGANVELTFPCPCVRSSKVQGLPKFKYFYYCSLQCDMFQTPTEDEKVLLSYYFVLTAESDACKLNIIALLL